MTGMPSSASTAGEGETSATPAPYAAPPPPPEAYYPYYYPHPAYAPPPHDGQPHGEGATNGNAHPVPQPYFPLHPAVYPPYSPYAHPPPVPYAAPPAVISPPHADANSKSPQAGQESCVEAPNKGRKKARAKIDSPSKGKKAANEAIGMNGVEARSTVTNGYQTTPGQPPYELPGGGSELNGATDNGHMVPPV